MCNPLFGKQESQEAIQESLNQAKILNDSRITSIKTQSCGPSALYDNVHMCNANKTFLEMNEVAHYVCTSSCTEYHVQCYVYRRFLRGFLREFSDSLLCC